MAANKMRQAWSNFSASSLKLTLMASLLSPVVGHADQVVLAEQKLLSGLQSIQNLSMDSALLQFSELSAEYPKYKLAQLVKADLLALKAGNKPILDQLRKQYPNTISKLEDEALVRWKFANDAVMESPGFDKYVLKPAQQSHLVLVSLDDSRLYLYERAENGEMVRVADYYVTMGRNGSGKLKEGDRRTPLGIYHVVDQLPGERLPDLYGVGALPLNYPNQWDKQHGKTGSGIWLHGTPSDTYTRAPRASRGCVVLNNNAMQKLLSEYKLPFATPVIIVDEAKKALAFSADKQLVLDEVKAWLADNQYKTTWEQVSVYRYPNEEQLFYVTFPAEKQGDLVHQFWQRDHDGGWRMVIQTNEPIKWETRV